MLRKTLEPGLVDFLGQSAELSRSLFTHNPRGRRGRVGSTRNTMRLLSHMIFLN